MRGAYVLLAALSLMAMGCGASSATAPTPPVAPNTPAPGTPVAVPTELVPANVNTVGTKGRDYGGDVITEPISQLWKTKDKLILMEIEYSVKLYQAEHGEFPASWEEFQTAIVQPTGKPLPSLQPGHEYVYDPKTGQLFVKRPKATPAPQAGQ